MATTDMTDVGRYEDVLGQLTRLKAYNHMCLCFPLDESTPRASVAAALKDASVKLTTALPWLGGKAINRGSGPGNSGLFTVAPCAQYGPPNSIVDEKDCTDILPSYKDIMAANAPSSVIDGAIIAPRPGFPKGYDESETNPAAVLLIRINWVKGGLLLDFAAQHNIMDGGGLFQSMRLLAAALRGEEFPADAVAAANLDRRNLFTLAAEGQDAPDFSHLRAPAPASMPPLPKEPFSWHHFRISPANQTALKEQASKKEDFVDGVGFVSTNDALCAFMWQRVAALQLARGGAQETTSKFSRAIDARKPLGVPADYMGVMVANATTWQTLGELAGPGASLARVTSVLRRTLAGAGSESTVRSFASMVAREPDKSSFAYGGAFNAATDLGCSSVAHVAMHKVDFGPLLRHPDLVRRPTFGPLPRTVYFMPQTPDASVDALGCFTESDLKALRADAEWVRYFEYIG